MFYGLYHTDIPWFESKLQEWLNLRDSTLDEIIRLEGLGDNMGATTCSSCDSTAQRYRCLDCFGRCALQCRPCLLKAHTVLPLHRIQVCFENYVYYALYLLPITRGMEWNLFQEGLPERPWLSIPTWAWWLSVSVSEGRPTEFCCLPYQWGISDRRGLL